MIRWPVQSPCSWYMLRKHNDTDKNTMCNENKHWKLKDLALSLSLEHLEGKDYDTMDITRWSRWLCWWLRTTLTLNLTLTLTLARCGGKPDPITEIKPDHYSLANVPLSRRGPLSLRRTIPPTSSKPVTQLHPRTRNVVHPEMYSAFPLFTRNEKNTKKITSLKKKLYKLHSKHPTLHRLHELHVCSLDNCTDCTQNDRNQWFQSLFTFKMADNDDFIAVFDHFFTHFSHSIPGLRLLSLSK